MINSGEYVSFSPLFFLYCSCIFCRYSLYSVPLCLSNGIRKYFVFNAFKLKIHQNKNKNKKKEKNMKIKFTIYCLHKWPFWGVWIICVFTQLIPYRNSNNKYLEQNGEKKAVFHWNKFLIYDQRSTSFRWKSIQCLVALAIKSNVFNNDEEIK